MRLDFKKVPQILPIGEIWGILVSCYLNRAI
jgi:hypothetical protein